MNCSVNPGPPDASPVACAAVRQRKHFRVFRLPAGSRAQARILFAFAIFLALVWVIQRSAGSRQAAFGSAPDEPSHYIGGLVSHDYFAHAFETDPISFARDYYIRV